MAFLYCREEQMALDTVAETVAKAYVGIGKLKKPEYFRTWLTRILINEALRAKEKIRDLAALGGGCPAKREFYGSDQRVFQGRNHGSERCFAKTS